MLESFLSSSLPILLTAILGIVVYSFQKVIDRRAAIRSMRREFYSQFVDSWLARHKGRPDPEVESTYSRLRLRLYVVSSDQVIRSFFVLSNFMDKIGKRSLTSEEVISLKRHFASLILAMRKDCYEKSRLEVDEVSQYMPFRGTDPDLHSITGANQSSEAG